MLPSSSVLKPSDRSLPQRWFPRAAPRLLLFQHRFQHPEHLRSCQGRPHCMFHEVCPENCACMTPTTALLKPRCLSYFDVCKDELRLLVWLARPYVDAPATHCAERTHANFPLPSVEVKALSSFAGDGSCPCRSEAGAVRHHQTRVILLSTWRRAHRRDLSGRGTPDLWRPVLTNGTAGQGHSAMHIRVPKVCNVSSLRRPPDRPSRSETDPSAEPRHGLLTITNSLGNSLKALLVNCPADSLATVFYLMSLSWAGLCKSLHARMTRSWICS
jgi:hypothetical protein